MGEYVFRDTHNLVKLYVMIVLGRVSIHESIRVIKRYI
jgi:hypothetical protein